jgi:hypothetical protein
MVLGGVVGAVAYGASSVAALAASPSPGATAAAGTATSNEDPAHEAGETPEQEAAENNGTARHGRGPGGAPNEDPAHEAAETPEQEAREHAAQPPAPTAMPTPSGT